MTELRDLLREGVPLERKFTVRVVSVPEPEKFSPSRVLKLRRRLNLSQSLFASLLGVSTVLVQSWEQGTRVPSPLARRLLAEIERDTQRWLEMIAINMVGSERKRKKSA